MSKPKVYVGLDVAETMGVAIYDEDHAKVLAIKGYPYTQTNLVFRLVGRYLQQEYTVTIVMEKPVHFQNAKTSRSLLERYGYIKWSLLYNHHDVVEVNLNSVRAFLKCRNKKEVLDLMLPNYTGLSFTDDKSDALACCLFQAHQEGNLELPIVPAISDWRD